MLRIGHQSIYVQTITIEVFHIETKFKVSEPSSEIDRRTHIYEK